MVESDVRHTPSTRDASRHVDVAFLPSAFARDEADPLRAIAFWNGQHPYVPVRDAEASALRSAMRAERIGALARLVPQLIGLANDPRPEVRATFATCFSIL